MVNLSENAAKPLDRRAERSRAAIVGALNTLLLDETGDDLSASAVARLAGVGRSTFYEHFASLDALIQSAIAPLFGELARTSVDPGASERQRAVLEHIWTKRRLARVLLHGRRSERMIETLTVSYVEALEDRRREATAPNDEDKVTATFLAAGTIGVLRDWLTGRLGADVKAVASVLRYQGAEHQLRCHQARAILS
jgi:AcrR family transcriptional regulator